MTDLFPDAPRRPPRVLLKVYATGHGCADEGGPYSVHLCCDRCGHDAGWSEYHTKRDATSQPCPICNASEPRHD